VDGLARGFGMGSVATGIIFTGLLFLLGTVAGLPFSVYSTFVLEERFGFNKTTPGTFVLDRIKGIFLTILIGGPACAAIFWFFEATGHFAWLYCWGVITLLQLVFLFLAPVVIMPLFNKFQPLEDGPLKESIEGYAKQQHFQMKGVFTMDGSKRSTKANAFFTGFGRFRRIVLFDTLIEKFTVSEMTSILAHEMGHFKKRHILQGIIRSTVLAGFTFFLLSLFINNEGLFAAFRMEYLSVYASLFFFGFLYTPIAMVTGVVENAISRRHEYQADAYAVDTFGRPEALISGLKKLSIHNLSDLTPHGLKIFLSYSHPPVLERIRAIRQAAERLQEEKTIDTCTVT
jgi:STE24 endopeptidase